MFMRRASMFMLSRSGLPPWKVLFVYLCVVMCTCVYLCVLVCTTPNLSTHRHFDRKRIEVQIRYFRKVCRNRRVGLVWWRVPFGQLCGRSFGLGWFAVQCGHPPSPPLSHTHTHNTHAGLPTLRDMLALQSLQAKAEQVREAARSISAQLGNKEKKPVRAA